MALGTGPVGLCRLSFLSPDGMVVDTVQPSELNPLPAGRQVARFAYQLKTGWATFRGSVRLRAQTGETFLAVALVQDRGQLTAVPVAGQ